MLSVSSFQLPLRPFLPRLCNFTCPIARLVLLVVHLHAHALSRKQNAQSVLLDEKRAGNYVVGKPPNSDRWEKKADTVDKRGAGLDALGDRSITLTTKSIQSALRYQQTSLTSLPKRTSPIAIRSGM